MADNPYILDDDRPQDNADRAQVNAARGQDQEHFDQAPTRKSSSGCFGKIGCGCALVIILSIASCVGGLVWGFSELMDSEIINDPIRRASAHPEIIAITGQPIEKGFMFQGSINYQNDGGSANIILPISGPEGSGSLEVQASYSNGEWIYHRLIFVADEGGVEIDITPQQTSEPIE